MLVRLKCICGHVGLISRRSVRRTVTCIKCGSRVPIEPKPKAKFSRPWAELQTTEENADLAAISEISAL